MKIVMVASEANPLAKTGGLADVVYALSKELAKKHDISIFMPFYKISEHKAKEAKLLKNLTIFMSWRCINTKLYFLEIDGIKYYLTSCDAVKNTLVEIE